MTSTSLFVSAAQSWSIADGGMPPAPVASLGAMSSISEAVLNPTLFGISFLRACSKRNYLTWG
jgi:hypothetical protein